MKPGKKEKENEKKKEKASLKSGGEGMTGYPILRKCCPHCGSVSISRKTRKGGYSCTRCYATFQQPVKKEKARIFCGSGPKFIQADKGART